MVSKQDLQMVSRHQRNRPGGRTTRSRGDKRAKKSIIGILGNVAELGASRMEETIGKAKLRDAAIGTGIAVDKMLALTGQMSAVQVAVIMPTAEERAEMRAIDAKLDEITRRLGQPPPGYPVKARECPLRQAAQSRHSFSRSVGRSFDNQKHGNITMFLCLACAAGLDDEQHSVHVTTLTRQEQTVTNAFHSPFAPGSTGICYASSRCQAPRRAS